MSNADEILDVAAFLLQAKHFPIVDVRSPSEFIRGHIPGAVNIPLFTDEERARVGTLYKQTGRREAFDEGLRIVGPKLARFVSRGRVLSTGDQPLLMYCWRGGQRSSSMAWLFRNAGIPVQRLQNGYKAYRRYLRTSLARPVPMVILGGMTGSGKTKILYELRNLGTQVIDLEGLARHRGSVFGGLTHEPQPTTEQFENNLFDRWQSLDLNRPVWLEDESKSIGRVFIPDELFLHMKKSLLVEIELPLRYRVENLTEEYGLEQIETLSANVLKIRKRLGGVATQEVIRALSAGDLEKAATLLLRYYDKAYRMSMNKNRRETIRITLSNNDPALHARIILDQVSHYQPIT